MLEQRDALAAHLGRGFAGRAGRARSTEMRQLRCCTDGGPSGCSLADECAASVHIAGYRKSRSIWWFIADQSREAADEWNGNHCHLWSSRKAPTDGNQAPGCNVLACSLLDGCGIPDYVIAYRPETVPLQVVAVLHSKRDLRTALGELRVQTIRAQSRSGASADTTQPIPPLGSLMLVNEPHRCSEISEHSTPFAFSLVISAWMSSHIRNSSCFRFVS